MTPSQSLPHRHWRSVLADCWAAQARHRCEQVAANDLVIPASWARRTLQRADTTVQQRLHCWGQTAPDELIAAAAAGHEACAAVGSVRCGRRSAPGAARLAIEGLEDGRSDPATGLTTLEENVLALAASAIRAAQNIDATGCANGRPGRVVGPVPSSLHSKWAELRAHAELLRESEYRSGIASLLSECLIIV